MNKNLKDQFMKWNSSINIACCLLTRIEGNAFSISAANTKFTERLKITDFESLEKIIENKDHLNKSLSHYWGKEWTVFCKPCIASLITAASALKTTFACCGFLLQNSSRLMFYLIFQSASSA